MEISNINRLRNHAKVLRESLETATCGLSHANVEQDRPNPPAVDYIHQQFKAFKALIPVCQDCVNRLFDKNWILLYCVNCTMSIWIYKPDSKKQYHYTEGEHIKWMNSCFYCHEIEYKTDKESHKNEIK